MKIHFSAATDIGLHRQINQDAYGSSEPEFSDEKGQLLVICDGMGGHAAGEIASKIGVETILQTYINAYQPDQPHSLPDVLKTAFKEANERIYAEGRGTMGTTGVASLFIHNKVYVANVGDSRAYIVRGDEIDQISRDHSFVWEQVEAGVLTHKQARQSHYRNMITRALGHRPDVDVDTFTKELQPGDTILLSSDGLHGLVEDPELATVVQTMPPEDAVHHLIEIAKQRGGNDNITVVIARVNDDEATDTPDNHQQSHNQLTPGPDPARTAPLSHTTSTNNTPELEARETKRGRGGRLILFTILVLLALGGAYMFYNNPINAFFMPLSATQTPINTSNPTTTESPATSPETATSRPDVRQPTRSPRGRPTIANTATLTTSPPLTPDGTATNP